MRRRLNNDVSGDIIKEIQEQDLVAPVGGSMDMEEPQSVSAVTAILTLTAWSHDKVTRKFGCGEVLTVSGECRKDGRAC